jgi:hemoglobin-like flavoprotein
MLSADSAAIVRATLPVVGASLDAITARFYETMFAERPELLDGLFNRGNQANGEQRRALAGSIAAFATRLLEHQDERPDELLARIVHKHTAVGVTDDQYVIVHKYLFGAIAHVLGEAVTPEVAAAWDEVYWLMAGALIAQEALLHAIVRTGDELTLSAPFGDVTLEDGDAPLMLVSAGIGCTPIVAMLDHLAVTGSRRRVLLLHADRSPGPAMR